MCRDECFEVVKTPMGALKRQAAAQRLRDLSRRLQAVYLDYPTLCLCTFDRLAVTNCKQKTTYCCKLLKYEQSAFLFLIVGSTPTQGFWGVYVNSNQDGPFSHFNLFFFNLIHFIHFLQEKGGIINDTESCQQQQPYMQVDRQQCLSESTSNVIILVLKQCISDC